MVKVKLNFKLGEKTVNNRTYNKNDFIKQLDEKIEKGILITDKSFQEAVVPLDRVIGIAKSYEILEDNSVEFNVNFIKNGEFYKNFEVSSSGVGNIDENNNIKDYVLIALFMVYND